MINEDNDRLQFEVRLGEKVHTNPGYGSETKHPLKLLFDLKNVKLMIMTFIKKRPYNVRGANTAAVRRPIQLHVHSIRLPSHSCSNSPKECTTGTHRPIVT